METMRMSRINLQLFGEGAGGEGSNGASESAAVTETATRVEYGKSAEADMQAAETEHAEELPSMEEFEALIGKGGKYHDLYHQKAQNMINERFKAEKANSKKYAEQTKVINQMMSRYGIDDGDINKLSSAIENDADYWEKVADERGLSVEQAKQMERMEAENRQFKAQLEAQQREAGAKQIYQKWLEEADTVKNSYPDFDLSNECQSQDFVDLLSRGVDMQTAYEVVHLSDIKARASAEGEKKVASSVRANGLRPTENGSNASKSGIVVKNDVTKLTLEDRREIARRVARGETIAF